MNIAYRILQPKVENDRRMFNKKNREKMEAVTCIRRSNYFRSVESRQRSVESDMPIGGGYRESHFRRSHIQILALHD